MTATKRILLISSRPFHRQLLKLTLSGNPNYEVREADPVAALEVAKEFAPHVSVADEDMAQDAWAQQADTPQQLIVMTLRTDVRQREAGSPGSPGSPIQTGDAQNAGASLADHVRLVGSMTFGEGGRAAGSAFLPLSLIRVRNRPRDLMLAISNLQPQVCA